MCGRVKAFFPVHKFGFVAFFIVAFGSQAFSGPQAPGVMGTAQVFRDMDGDGYYDSKVEYGPDKFGVFPKVQTKNGVPVQTLPAGTFLVNKAAGLPKGADCNDDPTKSGALEFKEFKYNAYDGNGDHLYQKVDVKIICVGNTVAAKYAFLDWNKSKSLLQSKTDDEKPRVCPKLAVYLDKDEDGYHAGESLIEVCDNLLPKYYFLTNKLKNKPAGPDCNDDPAKDGENEQKLYSVTGVDNNGNGKFKKLPMPLTPVCSSLKLNKKYTLNTDPKAKIWESDRDDSCFKTWAYEDKDGDGYVTLRKKQVTVCDQVFPAGYYGESDPNYENPETDCNDNPLKNGFIERELTLVNAADLNANGKYKKIKTASLCTSELDMRYKYFDWTSAEAKALLESEAQDAILALSPAPMNQSLKPLTAANFGIAVPVSPIPVLTPTIVTTSSPTPTPALTPTVVTTFSPVPTPALTPTIVPSSSPTVTFAGPAIKTSPTPIPGHMAAGTLQPPVMSNEKSAPTEVTGGWREFISQHSLQQWLEEANTSWRNRKEMLTYQDKIDHLSEAIALIHQNLQDIAISRVEVKINGAQVQYWFDYSKNYSYDYEQAPAYKEWTINTRLLNAASVVSNPSALDYLKYSTYKIRTLKLKNDSDYGFCILQSNHGSLIAGGEPTAENPIYVSPRSEMDLEFYDNESKFEDENAYVSLAFGDCKGEAKDSRPVRFLGFKVQPQHPTQVSGSCGGGLVPGVDDCGVQTCECPAGYHYESLSAQLGLPVPDSSTSSGNGSCKSNAKGYDDLLNRLLNPSKGKGNTNSASGAGSNGSNDLHCVSDICKHPDSAYGNAGMTECSVCPQGMKPGSGKVGCVTAPTGGGVNECLMPDKWEMRNGWIITNYIPKDPSKVWNGSDCVDLQCDQSKKLVRTNTPIQYGSNGQITNADKLCDCGNPDSNYWDGNMCKNIPASAPVSSTCPTAGSCYFVIFDGGNLVEEWRPKCTGNSEWHPGDQACHCKNGFGIKNPGGACEEFLADSCDDKSFFRNGAEAGWPCNLAKCRAPNSHFDQGSSSCQCDSGFYSPDGSSCAAIPAGNVSFIPSWLRDQKDNWISIQNFVLPNAHAEYEQGDSGSGDIYPTDTSSPSPENNDPCSDWWSWLNPSCNPEASPTPEVSEEPSMEPSSEPSVEPSIEPSVEPSTEPSTEPSDSPSPSPTPTYSPYDTNVSASGSNSPSTGPFPGSEGAKNNGPGHSEGPVNTGSTPPTTRVPVATNPGEPPKSGRIYTNFVMMKEAGTNAGGQFVPSTLESNVINKIASQPVPEGPQPIASNASKFEKEKNKLRDALFELKYAIKRHRTVDDKWMLPLGLVAGAMSAWGYLEIQSALDKVQKTIFEFSNFINSAASGLSAEQREKLNKELSLIGNQMLKLAQEAQNGELETLDYLITCLAGLEVAANAITTIEVGALAIAEGGKNPAANAAAVYTAIMAAEGAKMIGNAAIDSLDGPKGFAELTRTGFIENHEKMQKTAVVAAIFVGLSQSILANGASTPWAAKTIAEQVKEIVAALGLYGLIAESTIAQFEAICADIKAFNEGKLDGATIAKKLLGYGIDVVTMLNLVKLFKGNNSAGGNRSKVDELVEALENEKDRLNDKLTDQNTNTGTPPGQKPTENIEAMITEDSIPDGALTTTPQVRASQEILRNQFNSLLNLKEKLNQARKRVLESADSQTKEIAQKEYTELYQEVASKISQIVADFADHLRAEGFEVVQDGDTLIIKAGTATDTALGKAISEVQALDPEAKFVFDPLHTELDGKGGCYLGSSCTISLDSEAITRPSLLSPTAKHEIFHWKSDHNLRKGEIDPANQGAILNSTTLGDDAKLYRSFQSFEEIFAFKITTQSHLSMAKELLKQQKPKKSQIETEIKNAEYYNKTQEALIINQSSAISEALAQIASNPNAITLKNQGGKYSASVSLPDGRSTVVYLPEYSPTMTAAQLAQIVSDRLGKVKLSLDEALKENKLDSTAIEELLQKLKDLPDENASFAPQTNQKKHAFKILTGLDVIWA